MPLSEFGLQSPSTFLAFVTLVGLLSTGGYGVILLGNGVRLRDQDPKESEKELWASRKYLVTAVLFLTIGSFTILLWVGLLVLHGLLWPQKRYQEDVSA